MPKVGEAYYEVSAHDAGLDAALDQAEAKLRASGNAAEKAFSGKATDNAKALSKAVQDVGAAHEQAGSRVGGFSQKIREFGSGAVMGAGMAGFQMLTGGIMGLADGFVNGAARNEQYRVQLEVMLGTAGKARDRLAELTEFAKTTPFELPEVIAASNQLQVFTDGALATGDGLRMVGDVAAGVGRPIGDVSFWFGRLYDAMRSGQPLGEATMNLQQMGAMSGSSRTKLEALSKSVADGKVTMTDAWAQASKEFSRFGGMMDRQSQTLSGQWSNLTDTIGQGLAGLGEKALPAMKAAVVGAISVLGGLFSILGSVADGIGYVVSNAERFRPVIIGVGVAVGAAATPALIGLGAAALGAVPGLLAMAAAVIAATWPFAAIAAGVALLVVAIDQNFLGIGDVVRGVMGTIQSVLGTIFDWIKQGADFVLGVAENLIGIAGAIPGPWQGAANDLKASIADIRESLKGLGTTADEAGKKLGGSGGGGSWEAVDGVKGATPAMDAAMKQFADTMPKAMDAAGQRTLTSERLTLGALVSDILSARSDFSKAWAGAIDESTRLQQIGLQKQLLMQQMADLEKEAENKAAFSKLSAAEKIQRQQQYLDYQTQYAKLLAEEATYGTKAEQITKLNNLLQSKAMRDGLNDLDPAVRAAWQSVYDTTNERLTAVKSNVEQIALDTSKGYAETLVGVKQAADDTAEAVENRLQRTAQGAYPQGKTAGTQYAAGLSAGHPATMAEASALQSGVKNNLDVGAKAKGWGSAIGRMYAEGLRAAAQVALQAALAIANTVARLLATHSPPVEGPLHEVEAWPVTLMQLYGDRLASQAGYVRDSVRAALQGAASTFAGPQTLGIDAALGGQVQAVVRVQHEVIDQSGALAKIGTSPAAVAAELGRGFDASAFVLNLRHAAAAS